MTSDEAQIIQAASFRARPGVRKLLLSAFLLFIFGVPLVQTAQDIRDGSMPRVLSVFTRVPRQANLRSYEHDLEESSFFGKTVRPWVQFAWLKLFQYAGEKVVVGRDGWLFYKPDVDYLVAPGPSQDTLAAILDFRDQLVRRGIRLMVLPLPGKPAIYPDKLTGRAIGVLPSPTRNLISKLREAGVEAPDLSETFAGLRGNRQHESGEPCYLLRDTHWSAVTARLAAEHVAQRVLDLGWISPGEARFDVVSRAIRRRGDLARMLVMPPGKSPFPDEETVCGQVVHSGSREQYRDDPASPVLLLGDSFLRIYETDAPGAAGFIAHFARSLRMPVASIVNDGGASTLVRQELSRRSALLENKKLVIWQFVERDIAFGSEGWKKVALPPP